LLKVNIPFSYQNVGLNQNLSQLRLLSDQLGNVLGFPVIPLNPIDGTVNSQTSQYPRLVDLAYTGLPLVIWHPATGKRVRLFGFDLAYDALQHVSFADGDGNVFYKSQFQANVGRNIVFPGSGYLIGGQTNQDFSFTASGNGTLFGTVWGHEE
jgi:hypothetical protein